METELKIVYSIIGTVKRQANDDFEISERMVRGFVQDHRSMLISDYSNQGMTISDECFQYMGYLQFTRSDMGLGDFVYKGKEFYRDIPKVIRLKDNAGIMVERMGINIPIVNSEEFQLSRNSLFNKFIPKGKFIDNKITVHIGNTVPDCSKSSELKKLFEVFYNDNESTPLKNIFLDVRLVLDNPDDAPNYNWRRDPFPFPSELIDELKTNILRKEFNIIASLPNDKVTDGNATDTA